MIKINSQNQLLLQTLNDYFVSKGIYLRGISEHLYNIDIKSSEQNLIVAIDKSEKTFSLPIDINSLTSYLSEKIKNLFVLIKGFKYFPYKRLILKNNKKSYLTDIQNIIFYNLFFSKLGIDKQVLYEIIWNKDKDISINKLDTHLTNLKTQLLKEIELKINFQSNNKILQLLID